MKTGEEIAVKDMDDNHLLNTIAMLERGAENYRDNEAYAVQMCPLNGDMATLSQDTEVNRILNMTPEEYIENRTPYKTMIWHAKRRGLLESAE